MVSEPDAALDAEQRSVVELPDDADAVVLGAGGTGKSTIAVELVADRLLGRGWPPDSVLVIAASRASAAAMRDRIARRVPVPAPGPLARTLASLAFEIVRGAAAAQGRPAPALLTGADQDRIVAELLAGEVEHGDDGYWPEAIDREVRGLAGFRAELRELQARLLERGVVPARLAGLGAEHDRPGWVAAARFLDELEDVQDTAAPGSADATELVIEAAVALDRGAPLGRRLRLIVVDDAQELGVAGLRLVVALARAGVRVIALGDPDLATGGFRGAVPGGFLGIAAAAGRRAVEVVLPIAHRQAAAVRDAVGSATGRIGAAGAGRQRSAAAAPGEGSASSVRLPSRAAELAFIARRLRELRVRTGAAWSSMAVVVRTGAAVTGVVRELRSLDVPTAAAGVLESPRDDAGVRAIVLALEVALGRRGLDPDAAAELLGGPLGRLDAVALRRLRAALRQGELAGLHDGGGDRGAGELLVAALAEPGMLAGLDLAAGRAASRLAASLSRAREEAAAGAAIDELVWSVWAGSGLAELWGQQAAGSGVIADEANRHLDAIVALSTAAKRFVERRPDAPGALFLDAWGATSVQEDSLAPRGRADAVLVGTPSALIGREFEAVVVAGVQDGVWPNPRVRGSLLGVPDLVDLLDGRSSAVADRRREVLHDELRLFAASFARASSTVLVTAVEGEDEAPSAFLRLLPEGDPGPDPGAPLTLRGLVGRLRRELARAESPAAGRAAAAALARLAAESVAGADPAEWAGLAPASTGAPLIDLADPEAVVRVSPSRIEAFEECELDWAIGALGGGRATTSASLGTIVHAVAQELPAGSGISAEELYDRILAKWGELDFEADWVSERSAATAQQLARRLVSYLRDVAAEGGRTLGTELSFELEVGRARLRGQLDRIEEYPDGTVLVADLKTGQERAHGTAAAVADHAQLAAYQLAAVEQGMTVRGAALIVLGRGSAQRDYLAPEQPPLDEEGLAAFRRRVEEVAVGMAGAEFRASVDRHCLDPFRHSACRVHIVRAVTS